MPGSTDLYFLANDAELETWVISFATFLPFPMLWGRPAGVGASPADAAFVNDAVRRSLEGEQILEPKNLPIQP